MPNQVSWDPAVFERIYARSDDPWQFESSAYEKEKRATTFEALRKARDRFGAGFEIGCATGMLTVELARLCNSLLAVDVASRALSTASRRCGEFPHVEVWRMQVPRQWPARRFDLIVLSEVLYFLSREDVALVARRTLETLREGGFVLLVNWTGETDTPCTGDEAAALFMNGTAGSLTPILEERHPSYRIDLLANATQPIQQLQRAVGFAIQLIAP